MSMEISGRYGQYPMDYAGRLKAEQAEAKSDDPKKPEVQSDNPEKPEEKCTGNTDKVDREIEKLREKQKELEQQLQSATDDKKIEELKSRLAQVESELRQKDTDTYRRQHSTFSRLV